MMKKEDVKIRDVKLSDSDFLYLLYTSRSLKDILTPIKYEEQKIFVQKFIDSDKTHPYLNWNIIEINHKPIGSLTLHRASNELGFWIIPEFQGKGIGPIAVKKFMYLCGKKYYSAFVRPDNHASISLVKKLGFELTHHKYILKSKD